ncbi:BTB/POZ and TAZ domain-containing protein 1 [Sarracenia purpurea var. burkii]
MAITKDSLRVSSQRVRRRSDNSTTSPTNCTDGMKEDTPFPVNSDQSSSELPEADVQIVTSGGLRIPVHRSILASASPALESIIDRPRKHRSSERTIPLLGVPCEAVSVFVRFLYTSKCSEEELDKYGIHLLAVSHVFLVPQLKQRCTKALAERLTIDNVVDVLQLARLCDAPDLHLKCMKLVSNNFKSVEKTEGWKFLQDHDPALELQILQFIDEAESRKKRTRRHREEQSLYMQLSEAMECLEHICTEGCMSVGPSDMEPTEKRSPCSKFATCRGLQLLIRHFATCKRRAKGGCSRCKRMWQLLRLHSSICDQLEPDLCRVPLCRQFKVKAQQVKKGDDARWKLLVRKVASAKVLSSLSLPKRKREVESREVSDHHGMIRSFKL